MYWALPLAVGVATLQTTVSLTRHFIFGVRLVDLDKLVSASAYIFLGGVLTTHIEKLKSVIQTSGHNACLSHSPKVIRRVA
jgi:hypothetical protein